MRFAVKKKSKKPLKKRLVVKRKDVGCPNPHRRLQVVLTPKQVEKLFECVRSTIMVRGEKDTQYLTKIMKDIQRQLVLNDFFDVSEALVPR